MNSAVIKIPGQILYGLFLLDEEMIVWMPGTADIGPRRPPGAGGRVGEKRQGAISPAPLAGVARGLPTDVVESRRPRGDTRGAQALPPPPPARPFRGSHACSGLRCRLLVSGGR